MSHHVSSKNSNYMNAAIARIKEIAETKDEGERAVVLQILLKQNDDLRDEIKRKITERTNYINWMLIAFGAMFSFSFAGMYHYVFAVIAAPFVGLSYWKFFQNSYLGHQKIVNFLRDFVEPGIELLSGNCVRGWQSFLKDQHDDSMETLIENSTSRIAKSAFSVLTLVVAPLMFLSLYIVQTLVYPPPSKLPWLGISLIVGYYLLYALFAARMWSVNAAKFRQEGIQ